MTSEATPTDTSTLQRVRLDKWLWAARFFKTRGLAVEAIDKKRIRVNDTPVKPAKDIRAGDVIEISQSDVIRTVTVRGVSERRGSATVAAELYLESEASVAKRLQAAEQRRLAPEPAHTITTGRPTKRDRRDTERLRRSGWNDRWSASLD